MPARQEHEHGNTFSGNSFDNSYHLGANQWRHVAFVEQTSEQIAAARRSGVVALGMPSVRKQGEGLPGGSVSGTATTTTALADPTAPGSGLTDGDPQGLPAVRWLMSSDVCKHCTHAACLDVCPTGALFRSEFGSVVVQPDVCNGCGYCVAACPFGVIDRREKGTITIGDVSTPIPNGGVAQKCTLCYDRLLDDETPACAKTCPTTSIKFGEREEMVATARERVAQLHAQGMTEARLYGANDDDGVGGTGSVFLLLDDPEVYGLPPDPVAPSRHLASSYKRMLAAAGGMAAAAAIAFVGGGV